MLQRDAILAGLTLVLLVPGATAVAGRPAYNSQVRQSHGRLPQSGLNKGWRGIPAKMFRCQKASASRQRQAAMPKLPELSTCVTTWAVWADGKNGVFAKALNDPAGLLAGQGPAPATPIQSQMKLWALPRGSAVNLRAIHSVTGKDTWSGTVTGCRYVGGLPAGASGKRKAKRDGASFKDVAVEVSLGPSNRKLNGQDPNKSYVVFEQKVVSVGGNNSPNRQVTRAEAAAARVAMLDQMTQRLECVVEGLGGPRHNETDTGKSTKTSVYAAGHLGRLRSQPYVNDLNKKLGSTARSSDTTRLPDGLRSPAQEGGRAIARALDLQGKKRFATLDKVTNKLRNGTRQWLNEKPDLSRRTRADITSELSRWSGETYEFKAKLNTDLTVTAKSAPGSADSPASARPTALQWQGSWNRKTAGPVQIIQVGPFEARQVKTVSPYTQEPKSRRAD